ncbi:MAG: DNA primase regulatory subunit PriL [Dehalococcoidia bacterium]
MDLKVLAKYPFLPEASRYIREEGPPLEEVLEHRAFETARHLAREKVFSSLESVELQEPALTSSAECLSALYAYPLARILVSCVGDPFLIRRFALAEASLARRRLSKEDEAFLIETCRGLGLDCFQQGQCYLHFADFLKGTKRLRGKEWKLVNQPVQRGYVLLGRDKFLRVVEGHLRNRFEEELPLEVNDFLLAKFTEDVERLKELLEVRKAKLEFVNLGKVRVTRFPPCMQKLLAAVQASENVPHPGRFALVAFLHNLGLGFEEIYRIFSTVPDFNEHMTRYQIEHITGQISGTEYTAPECSTMKSYGLCPGPDQLCLKITHPLNYYRLKGRDQRRRFRGDTRGEESASPGG